MLFRLLIALWRRMGFLPLSWLHAIGRWLGRLYDWIPNRERRTAQINLELCFPAMVDSERRALRGRVMQQMGCSLMELSYIWFRPAQTVCGLVRGVSGGELLQRAPGQGLLVLLPHLGCWEIVGLVLPAQEQVTSLYRPPRKPQLEAMIREARERSGATLVPTDNQGVRRIYQTLQAGGTTCILPDQQPSSSRASVFAPFFGVPALTMLLINRLARKTGARIVFAYAERLPRGEGFHIHYLPAPPGIDDKDPQVAATALNQGLEMVIQQLPEQYQWSYKRFRARPGDGASPYRRKS
jgi:Kdo2-lipid IVA lauroyltransferase/acyltransferase